MLEHLNQVDSLVRVLLEELVDQVLILLRNLGLEGDLLTHLVTSDCLLVASEGSIAMDKLVEEDSKGPNIELMVMMTMIDHFGSHVLEGTAKSVALALVGVSIVFLDLTLAGPPEITDLKHVVLVDEQVFRLQISVYETVLMKEVDAGHRLYEEVEGGLLGEAALFLNENE